MIPAKNPALAVCCCILAAVTGPKDAGTSPLLANVGYVIGALEV
jgi:hypothetical protein